MRENAGTTTSAKPVSAASRNRTQLTIVLGLTSIYLIVEAISGWLTGSLALLADAAHMLTDVGGLGLALFAIWLGNRPANPERTYGYYRTEILASLANAIGLVGVSAYILYEAWQRFQSPPEVDSVPMLAVAIVGLGINLVGAWLLHRGASESLNVQGAFLEVISDLLGSLSVIAAAAIMYVTGWYYADPLFSAAIGLFIIPRTWRLLREAVGILLEGTPSRLNLAEVRMAIEAVPGVVGVHDLHAWSITSGYVALTAHVQVSGEQGPNEILSTLSAMLKERFQVKHTTLQLEHPAYAEPRRHA